MRTLSRTEPPAQQHTPTLEWASCAHYDVFNHTGHSKGWHAIDNGAGNVNADYWSLGAATPAPSGRQFGYFRKCTCSSVDNNFPAITHLANNLELLDLLARPVAGSRSTAGVTTLSASRRVRAATTPRSHTSAALEARDLALRF